VHSEEALLTEFVSWSDLEREAPEFAAAVRARFEAHKHHVLASLKADGSPRVSGTEVAFHGADLTVGSMPGAMKALDLQRDGRFALHAHTGDGSMDGGDAKVAGVAVEVTDTADLADYTADHPIPPGSFHLFRLELSEAVLTSLHPDGDRIVIELWRPGQELKRVERT
jgi:hypothetical protein